MEKYIPVSEPSITQKEISYVKDAVESGWVSSLGYYINEFERKFSEFTGCRYALSVSNGTTALHLALMAMGIGKGDEVIIPDLTFIATANAVAYTGADPILVDIEKDTWCISAESIRRAVTSKTKAIIPVHLYGHPADMNAINTIAKEYGLFVLEDAAEAHGSEYKGKRTGNLGDMGAFSFYGNKIMTTGEGGMLTTNNEYLYERAKLLRDHAMSKEKRYWHTEIGYNYRMTNLQAALGLAQLERINELLDKKHEVFACYKQQLGDIEGISLNPCKEWAKSSYWMVCLLLDKNSMISVEEMMGGLKKENIDSRPFFYPISEMPVYSCSGINNIAGDISRRGINLPSSANLTKDEIECISKTVKKILCEKCN